MRVHRFVVRSIAVVALLLLGGVAVVYTWVGRVDVEAITPRLWVFRGVGGNVAAWDAGEGVVIVDTMTLVRQGREIRDLVATRIGKPVVAIVNTHYHLDHTHGNPAFDPGTAVVSTERTRAHLFEKDGAYWSGSPARELLPNRTFEASDSLSFRNGEVRLRHPGRGHTDGDLVAHFPSENAIHVGDLFFHGHYPNIDLEAGGSVRAWIETIDRVLALEFETVIPGHGPVTDRQALVRFQDFLRSLWSQVERIRRRGGTLDDAHEEVRIDAFGLRPITYAPFLNRGFVIGRVWEEMTASRPGPEADS